MDICTLLKEIGKLGLTNDRIQWEMLATKWVVMAISGHALWQTLVHHHIQSPTHFLNIKDSHVIYNIVATT